MAGGGKRMSNGGSESQRSSSPSFGLDMYLFGLDMSNSGSESQRSSSHYHVVSFYVDAQGNISLVSGSIPIMDVWSNNSVKYCVEFNEFRQPLRKGGSMLVKFIGSIAKVETYCPVGELNWHSVDKNLKAKMVDEIKVSIFLKYSDFFY